MRFSHMSTSPCSQPRAYRVDLVDPFSSLVLFSLYPVPIKVSKQPVYVVGACRVPLPFSTVELQKGEIREVFGLLGRGRTISSRSSSMKEMKAIRETHFPQFRQVTFKVFAQLVV